MSNEESTSNKHEDKRRFSRVNFDSDIHLVSAEGSWDCRLIDISLKGMLATIPASWSAKIGDRFLVELLIGGDDAVIRMDVSMMHIEEKHMGFRCEHIDLDSISHLRRLVELNLGNSEILHRELSELVHQ